MLFVGCWYLLKPLCTLSLCKHLTVRFTGNNFLFVSGNFVTDIILNVTEVDCVILNSGTLRSDSIHPPGKFKMKVTDIN